ncbi:MAG: FAD binding domain-containing protein [Bacteroidia bacterium]
MITEKKFLKPVTVSEALEAVQQHKDNFSFIAGGTDVMVNKFQGNHDASCLIDLSGIKELKQITLDQEYLKIGSAITLDELTKNPDVKKSVPVLIETARAIASPIIRKTATVGGNLLCDNRCVFYNQSEWWREAVGYCLKCDGDICIATGGKKNCFSKFVADLAVSLISLNASIEIAGPDGEHLLPLEEIYSGDGVNPHKFSKTSIIKSLRIPIHRQMRSVFKKLRQRETMEFSSLTTVTTIDQSGNIRIVLGGVDPRPVIIEGTAADDIQELIKKAVKKPRIVDNDVFSRLYRKEMIEIYLKSSFNELVF